MKSNDETGQPEGHAKQIIKLIIRNWETQNKTITGFFNKYEEDFYYKPVAPGKNRAIYLLGHLIAMNDGLLQFFGVGDRLYPELEPLFLGTPDNAAGIYPSLQTLKTNWQHLNENLAQLFNIMEPIEWLAAHTKVSANDFAADPSRNKLNVLISRVIHQGYHAGQLALLHPKI